MRALSRHENIGGRLVEVFDEVVLDSDELDALTVVVQEMVAGRVEILEAAVENGLRPGTPDWQFGIEHMLQVKGAVYGAKGRMGGAPEVDVPFWCVKILDRRVVLTEPVPAVDLISSEIVPQPLGSLATVTGVDFSGVKLTFDDGSEVEMFWGGIHSGLLLMVFETVEIGG